MDSSYYYYVSASLEIPNSGGLKVFYILRYDGKDDSNPIRIIERTPDMALLALDIVIGNAVIDYKKDYSK